MATASQIQSFLPSAQPAPVPVPAAIDWRAGLPVLHGSAISLRELRITDAPALLAAFGSADVTRLISPPPPTLDGFEKFITWTHRQREAGQSLAFGITLQGSDTVVGLFQVRALQPSFDIAEWGFALGAEHWGSGLFMDGAELVLDFVFDVLGVHRLEARAALKNGRGNGALQKLGAVQEGILHRAFLRHGIYLDQALWTILADARRDTRSVRRSRLVH
jgi:ribosomal-protein-alanine N-acetyltransferase